MSVKIKTIRDALYTKISGVASLKEVEKFMKVGSTTGYPFACIVPTGLDPSLLTNKEEQRTYAFKVVIQQEIKIAGVPLAQEIILDTFDDVLEAVTNDWSLGGLITNIRPISSDFGEIREEEGVILYAEMTIATDIISDPIN